MEEGGGSKVQLPFQAKGQNSDFWQIWSLWPCPFLCHAPHWPLLVTFPGPRLEGWSLGADEGTEDPRKVSEKRVGIWKQP